MNLQTFTIKLPVGTTNHSDPHLLCPPASWETIAVFFIGNYIAHAATVKLPAATPILPNVWICLGALLMPATGLVFGLRAFWQAIRGWRRSELEKATFAGALCMYVRSEEWLPSTLQSVQVQARVTQRHSSKKPERFTVRWWFPRIRRWSKKLGWHLARNFMNAVAIYLVYVTLGRSRNQAHLFRLMDTADYAAEQESQFDDMGQLPADAAETYSIGDRPLADATISHSNTQGPDLAVLVTKPTWNMYTSVSLNVEVHGVSYRHSSYKLVYVPSNAIVDTLENDPFFLDDDPRKCFARVDHLAKRRNIAKSLIAFLQLCFSSFSLVRARGNQIDTYGYAAFALTVAPYAVMAAVNLFANFFMPDYPSLYLVRNDVMDEIEVVSGRRFEGVVGRVLQTPADDDALGDINVCEGRLLLSVPSGQSSPPRAQISTANEALSGEDAQHVNVESRFRSQTLSSENLQPTAVEMVTADEAVRRGKLPRNWVTVDHCRSVLHQNQSSWITFGISVLGIFLVAAPVAIVGISSNFEAGSSSTTQRAVSMTWLATGQFLGLILAGIMINNNVAYVLNALPFLSIQPNTLLLTDALLRRLNLRYDSNARRVFSTIRVFAECIEYYFFYPFKLASLSKQKPDISSLLVFTVTTFTYGAPAIWGFIIVVQMLKAYGNCIRVY